MLTAGTSPASRVRATCAQKPSQSTCLFSKNGNKTADMPVILRRGLSSVSGSGVAMVIVKKSSSRGGESNEIVTACAANGMANHYDARLPSRNRVRGRFSFVVKYGNCLATNLDAAVGRLLK